ncbi:MAG: helix-hairpin-helix domain-containing protein [Chloroflexota bacterium]
MIPGLYTATVTALTLSQQSALAIVLQQQERGNILVALLLVVLAIILLVVFWEWWKQVEGEDSSHDKRILNIHETSEAAVVVAHDDHDAHDGHAETAVHAAEPHHDEPEIVTEAAPEETAPPAPVKPDDLTKIEGIGPKISELLSNAGILTFAQLAATDLAQISQILEDAGPRFQLADPSTWAQQASLAAAGNWEALAIFQDELKGGRQVPL